MLYQKYRPTKLKQIVGNIQTIDAINTMFENKNVPHAFLFTGKSGTGKTTIGRVISNMLESKGSDFKEINSADFRGIDTIRQLITNSQYPPVESKAKVWLIDEAHQMTSPAMNALLKILETPPSDTYFILCTTDPQKLLPTIKSRCSIFHMELLDVDEMKSLIKSVTKKENDKLESKVLETVMYTAQGSARYALTLLEQVLATKPKGRLKIASKSLALESQSIDLARALVKQGTGWKEIRMILKGLKGEEPETIRRSVLGYCSAILLNNDNPKAGLVMDFFIDNFYDTGFAGLIHASYSVNKS